MKRIVLLGAFITLFTSPLLSQYCTPITQTTLHKDQITRKNIEDILRRFKPENTNQVVDSLRKEVANCRLDIQIELQKIEDEISRLSLESQDILTNKDVDGIRKQINDAEESREKSKEELQRNLEGISRTGIFAVLIKDVGDIYRNKLELLNEAKEALSTKAINDLNGTNIKKYASVKNFREVRDVIESLSSGEARNYNAYYSHINYKQRYFLFVSNVEVRPLSSKVAGNSSSPNPNTLVINILETDRYEDLLTTNGVSEIDLENLSNAVNSAEKQHIRSRNEISEGRYQDVLMEGNKKIKEIEKEIEIARKNLRDKKEEIRIACIEYEVRFEESNINESALRVIGKLEKEIESLQGTWKKIKEREIQYKETSVPIEGEPAEALATKVFELFKQLKDEYGQFEQKQERIQIEDLNIKKYDKTSVIKVFRDVERIWIFAVPQENTAEQQGFFKVGVFAKFDIISSEPSEPPLSNSDAAFSKGNTHFEDKNYKFALQWFNKAASEGNPKAYYFLGLMYEKEYGVTKNLAIAFEWYKKASAADLPEAWYALYRYYRNGFGTTKDYEKAREACRKAAELGHEVARFTYDTVYKRP